VKTVLTDHKIDIRGNLERLEPAVMQDRTNEDLPCLRGNRLCFNLFVDDSDFSDKEAVVIEKEKQVGPSKNVESDISIIFEKDPNVAAIKLHHEDSQNLCTAIHVLGTEVDSNSENNPGNNPEIHPENNPENKPENNPENKPENNPEINPENNPENKPENNPENKPENNPENNLENNPEINPENNPENNPKNNREHNRENNRENNSENNPENDPENNLENNEENNHKNNPENNQENIKIETDIRKADTSIRLNEPAILSVDPYADENDPLNVTDILVPRTKRCTSFIECWRRS